MELTVALDLTFQPIEKTALKFSDFAATEAGHVNVVALRSSLIEMLLALHMHQVEFIYQPMPFKETQSSINGHAVNSGVLLAGMAQDLTCIQMLLRRLHNTQYCAPLMSHAQAARHQFCLQPSWRFSLG